MSYRAVLFDLDGTLLDTLDDLADSGNLALSQLGFPAHPREAYRYLVGDGVESLVRRALPADRVDAATVSRCSELLRQAYGERWAQKTRPYPGIPELLDALIARGLPMAVLSNKPDHFTRLCVDRLLPRWSFAVVVGARPTLARKPDPAGARAVAAQLGFSPHEILYLGDTNTDMQTAVRAEMYPVGALWGFRTADELRASGARTLIRQPLELLELVR
jgi:phosphoglycolate phosphatase